MRGARGWRLLASAALVVALGAVGGVVSGATKGPRIVVTPSTRLHKGQLVKVHGAGFKPKDTVFIVECMATASGQGQCDTNNPVAATITAKGVLPVTKVRVVTGKIGSGKGSGFCGTTVKNLRDCAISVGNIAGHDTASARIAFVRP